MSRLAFVALCAAPLPFLAPSTATWTPGAPEWSSVGALAFGPEDVLFVADAKGAELFAVRTGAARGEGPGENLSLPGFDKELAALLGVEAAEVAVHDMAVDARDGCAYFSVTRRAGETETPVLVRAVAPDTLELVELGASEHQRAKLPNAAEPGGRRDRRAQSVTDMQFLDGKLFVAGLSNEEFASKLRMLAFPFTEVGAGASVEIYHGAHGKWETEAPVRTFTTFDIDGAPHLLAAYTCTPLVKIPMAELAAAKLEPGVKITGTTVAELGNRNTPLDMLPYERDGKPYLLIANTSRGVMKVELAGIAEVDAITEEVSGGGTAGLSYETIDHLKGVVQLAGYDGERALVLIAHETGGMDLETVDLP